MTTKNKNKKTAIIISLVVCVLASACDEEKTAATAEDTQPTTTAEDTQPTTTTEDTQTTAEEDTEETPDAADLADTSTSGEPAPYVREHTLAVEMSAPEGKQWRRSIVHLHSTHSHDACDGTPRLPDGSYNTPCQESLRAALCKVRVDYAFLTDHRDLMARTPFLDLLQIDPSRGDRVIERDGEAVAGVLVCPDGFKVTTTVGMETQAMPLDFQGHLDPDPDINEAMLGGEDAEAAARFRVGGALVWTAHTESKTLPELRALAVDGLELYNLHANIDPRIQAEFLGDPTGDVLGTVLPFALKRTKTHPDLGLLAFLGKNQPSLDAWSVLLQERPVVGTAGTDAHENVLPQKTIDGERFDSYRRMMGWFSNYVLTDGPTLDDFEAALRGGRLFVGFDTLGDPGGFDVAVFDAASTRVAEMGDTLAWSEGFVMRAHIPVPKGQAEGAQTPSVRAELYRATEAGSWEVADRLTEDVAPEGETVSFPISEPGIYRLEVTMTPLHLKPHLDSYVPPLADKQFVWIYTNAFRLVAP
jgi:hypothetical protein